jgi:uncharacterized membrane protein
MIESIHTFFGFLSLIAGIFVLLRTKGTKSHKVIGRIYVTAMLGLNITAFGIYNLFGGFGVFHVAAIISLLSVLAGLLIVYFRAKNKFWVSMHYELMAWSYIGLLAATSNEAFVHVAILNKIAKTYSWLPISIMLCIIGVGAVFLYCLRSRVTNKVLSSSNA